MSMIERLITVEVGTRHGITGWRDENDQLRYRALEGERTITIRIPGDIPFDEQVSDAIGCLNHALAREHPPAWIESSSSELASALAGRLRVEGTRPAHWGQERVDGPEPHESVSDHPVDEPRDVEGGPTIVVVE